MIPSARSIWFGGVKTPAQIELHAELPKLRAEMPLPKVEIRDFGGLCVDILQGNSNMLDGLPQPLYASCSGHRPEAWKYPERNPLADHNHGSTSDRPGSGPEVSMTMSSAARKLDHDERVTNRTRRSRNLRMTPRWSSMDRS